VDWRRGLICTARSRRQSEVSGLEVKGNLGKFPRHFKGLFPIGNMRVRILRGQPGITSFCLAPKEMRNKAGNPGISRSRPCLQTPVSTIFERQSPKVSGHLRDYSRFVETSARDRVRLALRGPLAVISTAVLSRWLAKSGIADRALRDEARSVMSYCWFESISLRQHK